MEPSDRPDKNSGASTGENGARRPDHIFRAVIEATSKVTGVAYLRELCCELSKALGFKYVFIGEVIHAGGPGGGRVRTVALSVAGKLAENFEYGLAGTPCRNVVGQMICCYPRGVQLLFPEDRMLVEIGAESYIGVPLFDLAGISIGILSALDGKPMPAEPDARMILPHFATRAAIALERKMIEDERVQVRGDYNGLRKQIAGGKPKYDGGAVEGLCRKIAEAAHDQIFIIDRDFRIVYANEAAARFLGRGTTELAGRPLAGIFPEDAFAFMRDNLTSVFTTGTPLYREERFSLPSSGEVWLGTRLTPLETNDGGVAYILGVSRDITRQTRLMTELKFQRDSAQKYLDIAGVVIVIIDRGENVALINNKGAQVLGYAEAEIVGKNWFDNFIPERERETVRSEFRGLMSGKARASGTYENRVLANGGAERVIEWSNTVLTDEAGVIAATLSSGADVTGARRREAERERLIEELREANSNVKILSGLLPICASCKRIRDSSGAWQRLELYIEAHTNAGFTHGLCPECARKAVV
ncbi:MAG: PAS domain-containing protein [Deltaproteobacteria bacterium]|nr:PAS domain-containing protein [Deltaproteobacteria bacterium]